MTATRDQVMAAAQRLIGIPFVHQGRNEFGLDCIGLILATYGPLGLDQGFTITGYGRSPHHDIIMQIANERLDRIDVKDRLPGDIMILRYHRDPQHMAIVTTRGMIHAYPHDGVCSISMPPAWENRIVAAFHVPGVI